MSSPIYGIRIGLANRDRFFKEEWTEIEVEIDGRVQRFTLTDDFWNKCPEFRDRGTPVIKEWLKRHHRLDWVKGKPPQFELIPLGGNRFRLA